MNTIAKIGFRFLMMAGVPIMHVNAAEQPLTAEEFVYQASQVGIVEVAVGRMALANSKSSDVQRFALATIADRDTANDELKILARKKGLIPIDEATALEIAEDSMLSVSAEDFDKTYVINQIEAHKKAITLFSAAVSEVPDQDLQNYAREKLPKLERNLQMARELVKSRNE